MIQLVSSAQLLLLLPFMPPPRHHPVSFLLPSYIGVYVQISLPNAHFWTRGVTSTLRSTTSEFGPLLAVSIHDQTSYNSLRSGAFVVYCGEELAASSLHRIDPVCTRDTETMQLQDDGNVNLSGLAVALLIAQLWMSGNVLKHWPVGHSRKQCNWAQLQ